MSFPEWLRRIHLRAAEIVLRVTAADSKENVLDLRPEARCHVRLFAQASDKVSRDVSVETDDFDVYIHKYFLTHTCIYMLKCCVY